MSEILTTWLRFLGRLRVIVFAPSSMFYGELVELLMREDSF
ncbi:MAG: hypothetical protein ACP5IE_00565 [Infirmifilum sp.]